MGKADFRETNNDAIESALRIGDTDNNDNNTFDNYDEKRERTSSEFSSDEGDDVSYASDMSSPNRKNRRTKILVLLLFLCGIIGGMTWFTFWKRDRDEIDDEDKPTTAVEEQQPSSENIGDGDGSNDIIPLASSSPSSLKIPPVPTYSVDVTEAPTISPGGDFLPSLDPTTFFNQLDNEENLFAPTPVESTEPESEPADEQLDETPSINPDDIPGPVGPLGGGGLGSSSPNNGSNKDDDDDEGDEDKFIVLQWLDQLTEFIQSLLPDGIEPER